MSKFDEKYKFKNIRSSANPKYKKMKKTKVFEVMLYIFLGYYFEYSST